MFFLQAVKSSLLPFRVCSISLCAFQVDLPELRKQAVERNQREDIEKQRDGAFGKAPPPIAGGLVSTPSKYFVSDQLPPIPKEIRSFKTKPPTVVCTCY